MSESTEGAPGAGPSQRVMEIAVALLTTIFGIIVVTGSISAGINWGAEGPRAGFFPFYVGLSIIGASIVNLFQIFSVQSDRTFADWAQLRQVMSVVVPTAIYVALVPYLGIYVASILLIAFFMRWLGRYGWPLIAAVALGMPALTFIVFERWFLVPLPKGPIEELFGL